MIFWFHGPIRVPKFSNYIVYTLESRNMFFFPLIFIFLLRNRENLYGISKFISFATWSYFSSELHVPTTVILVLRYSISNSGSRCSLFFVTFVFCPLQVLKYCEKSHRFLKFNTILP